MTSEEIDVRPYRDGDENAVLDLFNAVFAEDDPNYHSRSREHWEWEFLRNPAGNQVILGIEPSGRVIGQYACLPAVVNLRGERVMCGQGIDSLVHPEYRRSLKREGAFLKIAKYYFDHLGIPSVNAYGYGLPNSKAFRIGVRMLKYIPISAPLPTLGRNLFDKPNDPEVGRDAAAGEISAVERFGLEHDALWARIVPGYPMAIVRDATYLNWRFVDCPSVDYRCFQLRSDGALRAAWVLRENWTGPPILAISELVLTTNDLAALAAILKHAVEFARRVGQQRVELWLPKTHPFFAATLDQGFITEDSPFNLCIKIYRDDMPVDWVERSWFYTLGDSDVF